MVNTISASDLTEGMNLVICTNDEGGVQYDRIVEIKTYYGDICVYTENATGRKLFEKTDEVQTKTLDYDHLYDGMTAIGLTVEQASSKFKAAQMLIKGLSSGLVQFMYVTDAGSERVAFGTNKVGAVPAVEIPADNAPSMSIVYYDVLRRDWRSFNIARLFAVVDPVTLTIARV